MPSARQYQSAYLPSFTRSRYDGAQKFLKMGHVTTAPATPSSGVVCHAQAGTWYGQPKYQI